MRNRRQLLHSLLLPSVFAVASLHAAPTSGTRRLAVLLLDRAESWEFLPPQLRKELALLGWTEGANLTIQWLYANGDAATLASLASQVARSRVDAILTRGTPATRALQRATSTVPVVTGVGDPVGFGFAASLARPGGNITGISYAVVEASRKHVELLREMAPRLSQLRVLLPSYLSAFTAEMTSPVIAAARALGVTPKVVLCGDTDAVRMALTSDRPRGEVGAFAFAFGSTVQPKILADLAIAAGVPTMFDYRLYVEAGGLASYRFDWDNQTERSAAQIDKVFRGEKPAQIPFEFPTRSDFAINTTTAKALGLRLPSSLLLRADALLT